MRGDSPSSPRGQYYRDLYNLDRVEALKGPNAMMFGRGGGGGVVNRVTKEAVFRPIREIVAQGGGYGHMRSAIDLDQPLNDKVALRLRPLRELRQLPERRRPRALRVQPHGHAGGLGDRTRITLGYEHLRDTRVADRGITSYQGRPADVDISTYYGNPADSHVRATVDVAARRSSTRSAGSRCATGRSTATTIARIRTTCRRAANASATSVALTAGRARARPEAHAAPGVQPQRRLPLVARHRGRRAGASRRAVLCGGEIRQRRERRRVLVVHRPQRRNAGTALRVSPPLGEGQAGGKSP